MFCVLTLIVSTQSAERYFLVQNNYLKYGYSIENH